MKKIFSPRNRGYLFANAFSITAIGFSAWIKNTWNHEGPNGTFIFSEFIIIPFVMGMISSWFWQKEDISSRQLGYQLLRHSFTPGSDHQSALPTVIAVLA